MKNFVKVSLLMASSALLFNCSTESIDTGELSAYEESLERRRGNDREIEALDVTIEAEDFNRMSGIKTETSSEGTDNIGWINNGDWVRFNNLILTEALSIQARVASNNTGGTIEIRLDSETGTLIGSLEVANTGGWQVWETVEAEVLPTEGAQDVYFVFSGEDGYLFNMNWFLFSSEELIDRTDCVQQQVINGSGQCGITLDIEPAVTITNDDVTGLKTIESNNIPEHLVGEFRNATISAQRNNYAVTLNPEIAGTLTSLQGDGGPEYMFGILLSGVELDPIAAEPWPHSAEGIMDENVNWDWNLEALTAPIGLDCNYAHVQPSGKYHYHGSPTLYDLIEDADGSEMVQVGWAADGFPIYYKYAFDNANDSNSPVVEMTSSYELKTGYRPGDGITAPCSEYNGAYSADYAYVEGLGTLDETNGRTGVTPEFPEGTYYYILTDGDSFPSIPRYFRGTPSDDFRQGGNGPTIGGPGGGGGGAGEGGETGDGEETGDGGEAGGGGPQ